MQEMKFRVYNKKLKLWYYVPSLIFCGGFFYESDSDFINDTKLNPEDIDVEWYTGEFDTRNKEICENDIISYWFYEDYFTAIVTKKSVTNWCFKGLQDGVGDELSTDDNWEDITILGNIHDNPELLG